MSKKYKKSPIIEALCEIHFAPDTSWDLTMPDLIYEEIQATFPKRTQLQLQTSQIQIHTTSTAEVMGQIIPLIRFQRPDDLALIQVGPNLLTIHHLKPYPSWENFFSLIEIGLNAHRKVVKSDKIRSISLRYINRIEITGEPINLEEYFEFRPTFGTKIPGNIHAFAIGVQIPYEKDRDLLNLQLASIHSNIPNTIAMMLDLNYSLLQSEYITWNTFAPWLHIAHKHIEETFEACITDKLRKTFEEIAG